MKNRVRLTPIVRRYLVRPALRYRHIWLPVASAAGAAFFMLCDYVAHAMVAYTFIFIWLYYALFLICRCSSVEVCRDAQGNLFIQRRQKATAQKSEEP
jgi:hypothetical protein